MTTYSFLDVNATITGPGGSFQLGSGAGASEEGIDIDMLEEKDGMVVGADGSIMHSLRASDAGTITVRLLKTSPTNAKLNQLYNTQKASAALWGQNVLVVSDTQRGDVTTGTELAFSKQAPVRYAKDGNVMEWKFQGRVEEILGVGVPDATV
jgi:hypothetical protein